MKKSQESRRSIQDNKRLIVHVPVLLILLILSCEIPVLLTPPAPKPTAPDQLANTTPSLDSVLLTWNDTTQSEIGFQVGVSGSPDGPYSVVEDVGQDTEECLIHSLAPYTSYYFSVRAVFQDGVTDWAEESHAKIIPPWTSDIVDGSGDAGGSTSLAITDEGVICIAYSNITDKEILYTFSGDEWTTETASAAGDEGDQPSLALDSSGNPHISYFDMVDKDLKLSSRDAVWSTVTVDSDGDVGPWSSLAIDADDNPHISYWDWTNDDLKYTRYSGAWSVETVDSLYGVGYYTSLVLDASGKPHISYYDHSYGDLKYAFSTGVWNITKVDTISLVGSATSIMLDSEGKPRISYCYDINSSVKKSQIRVIRPCVGH